MLISELQSKDIINANNGTNIGKIIDVDMSSTGKINYFVVEPKKVFRKLSTLGQETTIKIEDVKKIGKDVILVDLP